MRGEDILDSARLLLEQTVRNPGAAARAYLAFLGELARIATGRSELAPEPQDKRFADVAWKESVAYRALAQYYLAWSGALDRFVDEARMEKRDAERAGFVASLLVDAMSPTNTIGGNQVVDTGGANLLRGLENFVADLARNGGMPVQVDASKFAVGRNLATTPGSVVLSQRGDGVDPVPAQRARRGPQAAAAHRARRRSTSSTSPTSHRSSIILKVRGPAAGIPRYFAMSWTQPDCKPSNENWDLDTYVESFARSRTGDRLRYLRRPVTPTCWGSAPGGSPWACLARAIWPRRRNRLVHFGDLHWSAGLDMSPGIV